ncbi:MAG: ATP synthase subunit I [Streptosporangiales bacterium]
MGSLILRAARNQRVTLLAGVALAALCAGLGLSFGYGAVGLFAAVGVLFGVVNALITEVTMIRIVDREGEPSRRQFGFSSLGRLAIISAAALILVIVFWPNGIGTFFGLAIFQPVVIVLTGLPLLKQLRNGGGPI